MTVSKYVSILSWTSLFALEWLSLFGIVVWNAQNIAAFAIFLMLGITAGIMQSTKIPQK